MRASQLLTLAQGESSIALPTGYLEPLALRDREGWNVIPERYVEERFLLDMRVYDTTGTTLEDGVPTHCAVFDEAFQFECRADSARKFDLVFFKRPALLASNNQTNFLTARYPNMLRIACRAEAARFMKDNEEFTACEAELLALTQSANAESDLGKAA
jgi:hypothetical protein